MSHRPVTEPYAHDGGPVGALLCHGFTGSPAALRPWAEYLTGAGFSVELPRLPGHGTHWRDMALTRWPDWYAEIERSVGVVRKAGEIEQLARKVRDTKRN